MPKKKIGPTAAEMAVKVSEHSCAVPRTERHGFYQVAVATLACREHFRAASWQSLLRLVDGSSWEAASCRRLRCGTTCCADAATLIWGAGRGAGGRDSGAEGAAWNPSERGRGS
jgi:hypothetical protein